MSQRVREATELLLVNIARTRTSTFDIRSAVLDLSATDIGPGNGRLYLEFTAALAHNNTLTSLDLTHNEIDDAVGRPMGEVLACKTTLTVLDLVRSPYPR